MNETIQGNCWHCGHNLTAADYVRENNCLGCNKPTRVCRNCRHFAPGRPNACFETMTEPVLEKERANFCELFEPTHKHADGETGAAAVDLLKTAKDLFK